MRYQTLSWQAILSLVTNLAGMPELSVSQCAKSLGCRLQQAGDGRYRADNPDQPFASVEVRTAGNAGIVLLRLDLEADLLGYAQEVGRLGEPQEIDIVSPPILDPERPQAGPNWDYRYAVRHSFHDRPVWFGIEKTEGRERLVSVSIHFDS